jgi:cell wall assembly regulator SMI1
MSPVTIERLHDALAARDPVIVATLRAGASEDAIAAAEAAIGRRFPETLRALYRWRDGQVPDEAIRLYRGYRFMPLTELVGAHRLLTGLFDEGSFDRDHWWDAGWIPFLEDPRGDHLCVDTAGVFGEAGQVVEFVHDEPTRSIVARDLDAWLSFFAASVGAGKARHDACVPGCPAPAHAGPRWDPLVCAAGAARRGRWAALGGTLRQAFGESLDREIAATPPEELPPPERIEAARSHWGEGDPWVACAAVVALQTVEEAAWGHVELRAIERAAFAALPPSPPSAEALTVVHAMCDCFDVIGRMSHALAARLVPMSRVLAAMRVAGAPEEPWMRARDEARDRSERAAERLLPERLDEEVERFFEERKVPRDAPAPGAEVDEVTAVLADAAPRLRDAALTPEVADAVLSRAVDRLDALYDRALDLGPTRVRAGRVVLAPRLGRHLADSLYWFAWHLRATATARRLANVPWRATMNFPEPPHALHEELRRAEVFATLGALGPARVALRRASRIDPDAVLLALRRPVFVALRWGADDAAVA